MLSISMHVKLVLKNSNQLFQKLKSIFLTIVLVLLYFSPSNPHDRVTLYGKGMSLENVFYIVQKQTGYTFFYDHAILQNAKTVNLDLKDVKISEALTACLQGQGLGFAIMGKTVLVIKQKREPAPKRHIKSKGKIKKSSIPYENSSPDPSISLVLSENPLRLLLRVSIFL